jgi:hypothetical protein
LSATYNCSVSKTASEVLTITPLIAGHPYIY